MQLFLFFYQLSADVHGKGQVYVAVYLCLVAQEHAVHAVEIIDEGVVSRHFHIGFLDHLPERHCLRLELSELFCSFMAGVGHIEHISVSLGIEHDGVLVSLSYDADQFGDNLLLLCLCHLVLLFQVDVVVGQLGAQHIERCIQVGFLEHSIAWQHESHHQQDENI